MTTPERPSPAAHALAAARVGWRLLPLKTGSKRPYLIGWPDLATDDPAAVAAWWSDDPSANYGIHLGGSGLLVVDVDGDAGRASLAAAEAELGPLPESLRVKTPNGLHVYFTDPGGIPRRLGWRPGLDVLCGTHYTVGPGSVVDGRHYRPIGGDAFEPSRAGVCAKVWVDALRGIAAGGGDDKALHTRDTIHPIPPLPTGSDGGSGISGVQDVFARFPLVKRGTSHNRLFTLARHLHPLFRDTTRPPAEVLDELRRWWETGRGSTARTWADTLATFTDAWRRVDLTRGALAEALRAAQTAGCHPRVAQTFPDPEDAPIRLLAALVEELDRRADGNGFYLAQAEAALLLGPKRDKIGRWLRTFQSFGWLRLIEPASYTKQRANVYRWRLSRDSVARGGAEPHDAA